MLDSPVLFLYTFQSMRVNFKSLFAANIYLVILVFSGVCVAAQEVPAPAQTMPKEVASDTNKDGKPDRWEHYSNGTIVSVEADTDGDGTIDEKGYFDKGKLVKVEKDTDNDGKMDKWVTY